MEHLKTSEMSGFSVFGPALLMVQLLLPATCVLAAAPATESDRTKSAKSVRASSSQTSSKVIDKKEDKTKSQPSPKSEPRPSSKVSAPKASVLIPPPPPVVPTLSSEGLISGQAGLLFVGEGIEFMPASELAIIKAKTMQEEQKLKRVLDELTTQTAEKSQRASTFESLYSQGVVSRKELEACKKESLQCKQEMEETKQALLLVESKSKRIEKRQQELDAKQKPKQKSPKKK